MTLLIRSTLADYRSLILKLDGVGRARLRYRNLRRIWALPSPNCLKDCKSTILASMVKSSYMSKSKTPGEILKEARLKKGWTQDELTRKAGLGKNTYPKIERGISQPDPSSIKKLLKVLDIQSSDIPHLLQ